MTKRLTCLLLALVFCLSLAPVSALAAGDGSEHILSGIPLCVSVRVDGEPATPDEDGCVTVEGG